MGALEGLRRRLRLRDILFLSILAGGIVPLAVGSLISIQQNRRILQTQERSFLTRAAQTLSVELDTFLGERERRIVQLGHDVLAPPLPRSGTDSLLASEWVGDRLEDFLRESPGLAALRLVSEQGSGPSVAAGDLSEAVRAKLNSTLASAIGQQQPVYEFDASTRIPVAIVASPVKSERTEETLFVEAAIFLAPIQSLFDREVRRGSEVYLIDHLGEVLWASNEESKAIQQVENSRLVGDFVASPLNMTQEYTLVRDRERRRMVGRISPIPSAGWGVLIQRPTAAAYGAVREMVINTSIATGVLVLAALVGAGFLARRVSRPIQHLAQKAGEIAAGDFGARIEPTASGVEIVELAENFNRMSGYVEGYVSRLEQAASTNRELFIGTLRAFAAATEAKDPYTQGHAERVARYSRAIAKHLGLSQEVQERIWVGALVHDVGKIGIEDSLLRKVEAFDDEEFERMKEHTVIGARIVGQVGALADVVPIVRSHHEAWNGQGYPDGLVADKIPLVARVVAVADTLDAVTTTRPYQQAYSPEFAVERITQLAGTRFDAKVVSAFLNAVQSGDVVVESTGASVDSEVDFEQVAASLL